VGTTDLDNHSDACIEASEWLAKIEIPKIIAFAIKSGHH